MKKSTRHFGLFQTARNILANITFVLIDILISLWYTPFLIRKLGSQLFGFIPLANSVTNYFSIVTYSLNISIGRHITMELEKGETRRANQIFNTNLIASLLMISAAIPLGAAMVALAPAIFSFPSGREQDVQFLFVGLIAAFLMGTYRINYSLATFARNRFDLRNIVTLGARVVQILIILGLFNLERPNVAAVGAGAAGAALFNLAGDYYLWQVLLPELKVHWSDFRKNHLRLLFSTGAWTFAYQVGFILFLNVDMLVANRTLDLNLAGMFGALLTIPRNLRVISAAVGGVWGPSILAKYSQADSRAIDKILRGSIKLTGLFMALPIGLICGLANPFLGVWLGADFQIMSWALVIMVFPLCTNLIAGPFFSLYVSLNKLRIPALVTLGLGLLNLVLIILAAPRYGVLGIVAAGGLTLTLNYSVFAPIYVAKIMKLPWWQYLRHLGVVIVATLAVVLASYSLSVLIPLNSYLHLIVVGGLISLIYLALVYHLAFTHAEKHQLNGFLASIGIRKQWEIIP